MVGGRTITVENLDVMGDVGQSNVDDNLYMQPDQNFGHSNVVDDLNMQPNQNKGDVMGGGTITVENLDVMGDVGQSNVDDDLYMQPDQNFGHSNVVDDFFNYAT